MDIKNLIVKEYLESLTEKNELNYIFPILLEVMGFNILSKPKEFTGLSEYGKDIVAVGIDPDDKVKKRFYFELKGGADRDITRANFYGEDGIQESLAEASYNEFVSAFPKFHNLPLKIVIVHNGIIKGNIQSTFEGFLTNLQTANPTIGFDRWDISRLTTLFSEKLFGPYLLTDARSTKLFNRVLLNLNVTDGISKDYFQLLDILLEEKWRMTKTISRKWVLLFNSLKLIGFIIYTESKEYNNLEIAKRYCTHLTIKFWHWILKNKLEENKTVTAYFDQVLKQYFQILTEYFERTMPIANLKDGLFSEAGGRYEQIGYTNRTLDYIESFTFFSIIVRYYNKGLDSSMSQTLVNIINQNNVSARPLIDHHSVPIVNTLNLFIEYNNIQSAKNYLSAVLGAIIHSKEKYDMLPDANNSIENVIRFTVTGIKPVYYSDSTSPLLTVLFEYLAILDMEDAYITLRDFVKKHNIELGVFVPFTGKNLTTAHLVTDTENDLDEQLFSKSVTDGYQSGLSLTKNFSDELDFAGFKEKIRNRKTEFEYDYRTDKSGYPFLKDLAHMYFMTPYFPDKWRKYIDPTSTNN